MRREVEICHETVILANHAIKNVAKGNFNYWISFSSLSVND